MHSHCGGGQQEGKQRTHEELAEGRKPPEGDILIIILQQSGPLHDCTHQHLAVSPHAKPRLACRCMHARAMGVAGACPSLGIIRARLAAAISIYTAIAIHVQRCHGAVAVHAWHLRIAVRHAGPCAAEAGLHPVRHASGSLMQHLRRRLPGAAPRKDCSIHALDWHGIF